MRNPKFPPVVTEGGVSARIRKLSQDKNGKDYTLFVWIIFCSANESARPVRILMKRVRSLSMRAAELPMADRRH